MKKSQELMTKAFSDKGLGVQLPPFLSETDNISEDSSPKCLPGLYMVTGKWQTVSWTVNYKSMSIGVRKKRLSHVCFACCIFCF